jgi:hypothetical protein
VDGLDRQAKGATFAHFCSLLLTFGPFAPLWLNSAHVLLTLLVLVQSKVKGVGSAGDRTDDQWVKLSNGVLQFFKDPYHNTVRDSSI